jgi:TRAP-type uncharacterized transport system substrate-binding protein
MRKRSVMLTCMLLLGSVGTSEAGPPDAPDIVYIDGLPCNSLCQSYMAWSRKASSMSAQAALAPRSPKAHGATGMRGEASRSATRARMAKQAAPNSNKMRQAQIADSQPSSNEVAVSNSRTIQERATAATAAKGPGQNPEGTDHSHYAEAVSPGVAEKAASASPDNRDHLVAILVARPEIKSVSDLTNKNIAVDDRQSASDANLRTAIAAAGAGEVRLSEGQTKAINRLISGEVSAAVLTSIYPEAADWLPEIAGFTIFRIPLSQPPVKARLESAGDSAAGSSARTTQQQVAAATALAEHVTAGPAAPEQKANNTAEKTAAASPNNTDLLVALLMARPDIKSVSDLANKNVAIDARQSASNAIVRTAIAAAGATEVQLSEGQTAAIDRLINGEVPAAVLALVSPQAAEWFPEIAGFKILRVPLSPPALQARLEPAGKAAAASDTAPAKTPDSRPAGGAAAGPNTGTIQQQVTAATVIAEHVMGLRDAQKTAPASPNNDDRVVLLMARPDIKSISDLTGKDIAIEDKHSASSDKVRTAIAAAGAAEVQLSEGQTKAIDRLIGGEVPAAVLTLVYPETGFPQFEGFKIFRIPLAPRSVQARLETAGKAAAASDTAPAKIPDSRPAGGAAANSNAGTIQQQVTAATVIAEHVMTLRDAQKTTPASPNNDDRVVLLMARPDIKSISDLAGKDIAIDDRHSASSDKVRTAIAAAGAAEVQLSEGQTKAIDRLVGGEVPAAVLTLVYPETGFPQFEGFKIFRIPLAPRSVQARLETAGKAAAASDTAPAKIPDSRPAGGAAANSSTRTILEQVAAATALAEQVTAAAAAPEQKANNTAEKTAPASPNNEDRVALLMARPEITSVADLASKNIAIDDRQSASSESVRTAIAAAGASEVQLSEGQTKAISRLIGGEVPAAVLTLVSPEAAEWFPDIAGFKIFRVPLSPRSLKARL